MTISVQSNKNSYTANGVLKTFAYTFKIFKDADLTVTTLTPAGVTTSYTLDVGYTVTGAPGTGNVVFTTAPTDTHTVVILGTYDYKQETDYEDGDSFPAATHENALDKLTMLAIKADLEINQNNAGNATISNGVTSKAITLSPAQPDVNYYITTNMKNTTDSPPTHYNTVITAKSTSGFTISFGASINSANYSLDWTVTR